LVIVAALLIRFAGVARVWRTTYSLGSTVVAVVFVRVLVEGIQDPTSHNLWPFEVVIALILGFGCAFLGAAAGGLAAALRSRRPLR
jgi:uncharacterized membrane protein